MGPLTTAAFTLAVTTISFATTWTVDDDGKADFDNIQAAVIATWGPCKFCPEDFNEDGIVDVSDLLMVISNWGQCK